MARWPVSSCSCCGCGRESRGVAQLQGGLPAERELQLPPKDTRNIRKEETAEEKDMERAKRLRFTRGRKH